MRIEPRDLAAAVLSTILLFSSGVFAAGVEVLFDLHDRTKALFPSNLFTVLDFSQNTSRRVSLSKPDCAVSPLRCQDIDVLNTLDGFNIQPRLSIPFSGPIDPSSVNSDNVFLVSIGSTLGGGSVGEKVGINQVVWDPASNTLFAESDKLLEQHTRYALIVTDGVRDAQGGRVEGGRFTSFRHDLNFGQTKDSFLKEYREDLLEGLAASRRHGGDRVVSASIFTTMSTTSTLQKIQQQLKAATPAPASFTIGTDGERTVFPLSNVGVFILHRQVGTATFQDAFIPPVLLQVRPGVGSIAFGRYASPDYQTAGKFIPSVSSRTGVPAPQSVQDIYFNLVLPAGPKPAAGWPVAIYGHGFTDSKWGSPFVLAASMAQQGIATIAINVVGHGGGPLGSVTVVRNAAAPVSFPAGGRGIDQNGDGLIGSTEGSSAASPRLLIGSADALQQTTADLMQLVRVIQVGMDVDGDGAPDIDPARIYYFGQSFGGIYGTIFLGVERDVRVGVPNVPGGPIADIIRLSPVFRGLFNAAAAARGLGGGPQFNENLPLRDEVTRINSIPGAMPLQDFTDQLEWAAQAGNPVAYAPYLRKSPLQGNPVKSVIVQYARGDMTVPNPTATAIVRAGDLADRVTYYRNDVAFALDPTVPKNPHTFLTGIFSPGLAGLVAAEAQAQIATFFATDGSMTVDPDGNGSLFETPITLPLPEELNFLP